MHKKRDLVTKRDVDSVVAAQRAYPPCDWVSGSAKCQYPGTMTTSTSAGPDTKWFCNKHFHCESEAEGADITEASRDYLHPTREDAKAKAQREAREWLKARGMEHATREQMMAFCKAGVKALNERVAGREHSKTGWAEKLLAREAAGETLPLVSIEMAKAALGK